MKIDQEGINTDADPIDLSEVVHLDENDPYSPLVTREAKNLPWLKVNETRRTYTFIDGRTLTIERPLWLAVSSHGHRIIDDSGEGHYVFTGGVSSIHWTVGYREPVFRL